jgi:prevent-host-death family protein
MPQIVINLEDDITPVSDFRANTASILDKIKATGRPVILTQHGRSAAVLIDVASYQDLLEQLDTLRDLQRALEDEREGRVVPHDAALQHLRAKYAP